MNKVAKIKAEIGRQKDYAKDMGQKMRDSYVTYWVGRIDLCDQLLSFIDSLQQERPSEDLEDADKISAEIGYFNHQGLSILTERSIRKMGFKEGDRVRITIVKEDEK